MPPKSRIIIDTDPGIDDILAILFALSSPSSLLEVLAITLVRGNVDVHSCLRNIITLFHTLEKEISFRHQNSLPLNLDGCTDFKPLVAIGADEPLLDPLESDFFHGRDGLLGVHESHPHLSPQGEWAALFREEAEALAAAAASQAESSSTTTNATSPDANPDGVGTTPALAAAARGASRASISRHASLFTPSLQPAHKEILRLLRENPPNTITLVSIGPLTNFALAANEDPVTFLRAKEVVVMGGTVSHHGNVTPVAEFNIYADPLAAARVFALSGPNPNSTLSKELDARAGLQPYPEEVEGGLKVVMMGLDITERHMLTKAQWEAGSSKWVQRGSPLAKWMSVVLGEMMGKMERIGEGSGVTLHDPMCIFYVLHRDDIDWTTGSADGAGTEDIRVEVLGKWTRGMTVADRRPRRRRGSDGERTYDHGNWLGGRSGNRVTRMVGCGVGKEVPGEEIVGGLFGALS